MVSRSISLNMAPQKDGRSVEPTVFKVFIYCTIEEAMKFRGLS